MSEATTSIIYYKSERFHKGFNKELVGSGSRFFYLQDEEKEYKPIKMFASFNLNKLPTDEDFLSYDNEEE